MDENIRSLERKLNQIIDDELKKDVSQVDSDLIMACCDGLLRIEDIKRYEITESEMKESIDSIIVKKPKTFKKFSKQIKIMLIAAIIAVLLAIGSLGYAQYKDNIFNFSNHSTISFDQSDNKSVDDFNLGFIPKGFTLDFENDNKYEYSKEYVNGETFFTITKQANSNKKIEINTEYKDCKINKIDGIDYIEYGETEHGCGIVWEKEGYQYTISGNIPSPILLKIAASISEK